MIDFYSFVASQSGWIPACIAVFSAVYFYFGLIEKSPKRRKKLAGWLISGSLTNRYRYVVRSMLEKVDDALSADEAAASSSDVAMAWSAGLLKFAIGMSFLYPFVFAFGVWCYGDPNRFLSFVEVANVHGDAERRVLFALFVAALIAVLVISRLDRSIWLRFVLVFTCVGGFTLAAIFLAQDPSVEQALPVVLAILVLIFASHPLATVSAVLSLFLGQTAGLTGLPFIMVMSVVFFVVFLKLEANTKTPFQRHLIYALPLIAMLFIGFAQLEDEGLEPADVSGAAFAIVLILLPALNAFADFASAGLTRFLLRAGVDKALPFAAVYDLLSALAIFISLATGIIVVLAWLNIRLSANLFPLESLLEVPPDGYASSPEYWFTLMLLTTLIPTFIHFSVLLLTLLLSAPEAPRKWVGIQLIKVAEDDPVAGMHAKVALSVAVTFAAIVPVYIQLAALQAMPSFLLGTFTFGHSVLNWSGV
mmetsp:Transcript_22976/g.38716  ORF Transcript_22976/g.38716 Transcript_22976/m.38716 type:complete len:477 (+) Transcript_22976:1384-2814(+)